MILKKKLLVLFLAMIGTYSFNSHAVPSAYTSNCGPLLIENDTNSTLLRDNSDCKTVWVLPPTSGLSRVSGFTPNGNLGICRAVKDSQETYNQIFKSLRVQSEKLDKMLDEVSVEELKLITLKEKLIDYDKLPEVKDINILSSTLEDLDLKISKLMDNMGLADSKSARTEIKESLREAKEERLKIKEQLRELTSTNRLEGRKNALLAAEVKAQEEKVNFLSERFNKALILKTELQATIQGFMKHFDGLEGGYAHLDYNTGWEENVKTLNKKYSSKYDFKAISTKNAKVFANFVGSKGDNRETYMSSSPMILSYTFGGMKYTPWGEDQVGTYSALPSHLSGAVRLNLTGACPVYYENFFTVRNGDEIKVASDFNSKNTDFSVMVNYEYPAAFKFSVTASYNLYKFYEKIVKTTSKGGFFSSKTATEISENSIDRDTFNINWEDEDNIYSKEEKAEIQKTLKQDLIARVLHNMAIPNQNLSNGVPSVERMNRGSFVLARGISDTCGMVSIYCRGASWIVLTLDSIFGGSTAVNSYRSTQDRTATEKWSSSETRWVPATTGFYKK